MVNELHWIDPRRAVARHRAYLRELGFPYRGRDRYIFYGLCAWAGINLALLFDLVVGRSPNNSEMVVTSLAVYSIIMGVTLPFLKAEGIISGTSRDERVEA